MANATASLLWAACRPGLDEREVSDAIDAGADIQLAAELAVAQRISPLLERALAGRPVPKATADDAARVRAQSRLVLPRAARHAFEVLVAADHTPLVLKGAALVDRYGAGLRPMDDLDLVVRADRFDATMNTLLDAGWTKPFTRNRNRHEVTLVHAGFPGVAVDLHNAWSGWTNRSDRVTVDALWNERVVRPVFGVPVFVLPPEVELVMLAAHAAKPYHEFDRLIWIADVAIVAASAPIDWDVVDRFATTYRCRTGLAVALRQSAWLGVEAPAALLALTRRQQRVLTPLLSKDWPITPPTREQRAELRYALVDRRATATRLLVGDVFNQGLVQAPRRVVRMVRRYTRTKVSKSSRQPA